MNTEAVSRRNPRTGEYYLEMDGIRVYLFRGLDDQVPVVQIDTPEDSEEWKTMRVYLNDGRAESWR